MGTTPYKPLSQSVVATGPSLGEPVVPKQLLPVGQATSLAELAGEFAFFTPAVLYLYGGLTDEPLGDFRQTYGGPADVYHYRFPHRLFSGLDAPCGDREWNHALWAVRRHVWPALRDFYLSIMVLDPVARTASQVAYTDVEVLDSLAAAHMRWETRPAVTVAAFGIDGSDRRLVVRPSADVLKHPPRLVRLPPTEAMRRAAAAYAGRAS